jgi:hypothetical protein
MTVQELMEVLKNLDPNKEVWIHNGEWDSYDRLNCAEMDEDGDLVLYP